MREKDYINASDLGKVAAIKRILPEILPDISKVIYKDEYNLVVKILTHWQSRLYGEINGKKEKQMYKNCLKP